MAGYIGSKAVNLSTTAATITGGIDVDSVSDGTTSVPTGYVVNGSAKAWVYGTSAAVINASLNISSGVDNGTGDYTYTYTNAMASSSYSAPASTRASSSASYPCNPQSVSPTNIRVSTYAGSTNAKNDRDHMVTISGDLA
jgi:hypothetical protein